jgi:hypothetical protein
MRLVKEPSAVRGLAEPGFRHGPVRAQRACIVLLLQRENVTLCAT